MDAQASISAAERSNFLSVTADTHAPLSLACGTHVKSSTLAGHEGHGERHRAIGTGSHEFCRRTVSTSTDPLSSVGAAPVSFDGALEVHTGNVLSRTDTEQSGRRAPVALRSFPAISVTEVRFWCSGCVRFLKIRVARVCVTLVHPEHAINE